jgi:hypothetical protein
MRRQPILWKPSRDERLRTLLTRMKLVAARSAVAGA